jgi:hypothetical protein
MRRWISVAPLVLLTSLATGCGGPAPSAGPEDPRRHTEVAGGFSFVPPDGWNIRPVPGLKFRAAVGPAAAGFAPNINVVDESFRGPLDTYVQGNLASMRQAFQQFRLLRREEFEAAGGLPGARVVSENEVNGRALRQTYYFFARGDTKFVITCTALAEGGDKLDPVFEASLRTFRFDGN